MSALVTTLKRAFLFVIALSAGLAQADTVRISGYRTVGAGQLVTVNLPYGAAYVRKIYLQVQVDSYYSTQLQVIANSEVKGNFIVPGYDPSFTVNVSEVVSQISIQNIGSRAARIHAIHAELETQPGGGAWVPSPMPMPLPGQMPVGPVLGAGALSVASALSAQAIALVDQLEPFSDGREYTTYLLPIKKLAGRTYASANAHGDLSAQVKELLISLRYQIDFATSYIDNFMERDQTFNTAVALLNLQEQIDRLIQ